MNKNILTVVGITILFLGLAIQPSIATVPPEKIVVEPNVDGVEGLVAQLRVAINEKLEKYENIPKVADFWEIILYLLNLIVWILITITQVILMIIIILLAIITFPIWFYLLLIFIMSS